MRPTWTNQFGWTIEIPVHGTVLIVDCQRGVVLMTDSLLENPTPLQPNYVPPELVNRDDEVEMLTRVFDGVGDAGATNLVVEGPRGTGKSHLVLNQLHSLPDPVNSCYVPCHRYDTQYKALTQIHQSLFHEAVPEGHHTATLQRELEERTVQETVMVLDELDFLLRNDGDDLLYYLSRSSTRQLTLILITANHADLASKLEERTYSSLHPERLYLGSYSEKELFDILADRARKALGPRSLHRNALTRIVSNIDNLAIGLTWLRTAAEAADDMVTETVVGDTADRAYRRYVDGVLNDFSDQHKLVYQAIRELATEQESSIQTGAIYDRYQELCDVYGEDLLSHRRVSDFLKHLELLDLIDAEYHYGGETGKTREITLTHHPH